MTPAQFIGTLLASRDAMHLAHWNSRIYSEHKTLGEYYEGILELTDKFAEAYMGANDRVRIIIPETKAENARAHLMGLRKILIAESENYDSELENIIEEMLALVDKTLYLLTLT
jgi:DNA-binding ferritin-like protein